MIEEINYLDNLLKSNDIVVVSLSGGPDSMCLLNLLLKVSKKIKIIVAHINHNVRKESKDEEIFVKNYCQERKLIFETMKIENYTNQNFHKEARDIRYNYMEKIINKYNAKYLFTAHHGDDLIESILMHLVRGTSFLGYSGFKRETKRNGYIIVRPLINKSKMEIINYNKKNNIPYVLDKTNASKEYTRNRFRIDILPLLHKENNKVIEKFNKFSNLIIEYDDYIKNLVINKIDYIYKNNYLNISKLKKEEPLIQKSIIKEILYKIYDDNIYLLNDRHINLLFKLINSKKQNTNICFPNNLNIKKEYGYIYFNKINNEKPKKEVIKFEKYYENNNYKLEIIEKSTEKSNNIFRLSLKDIDLPLYIINKEDGLIIELKNGHKKVNRVFIDSKIPKGQREIQPILIDSKKRVLWIPGIKKSKFDKDKSQKCDIIIKYSLKEEFLNEK